MSASREHRCAANVATIRDRVGAACLQAGRPTESVRLIAVTKYVDEATTRLLVQCGCLDLAESRPQQLWAKAAALADHESPVRWHLIGHLQRNKVRRTLPLVSLVQTLDSTRLLAALSDEAVAADHDVHVLVEVNLSPDPNRSGTPLADVPSLVAAAAVAPRVRLRGLMGMASHPDSPAADARRDFARLRELRDRLAGEVDPTLLVELSMGMSGDFEEAILEGSTMVRVGSALVAGLD